MQKTESLIRHDKITADLQGILNKSENKTLDTTSKIDKILLHPVLGYVIFFGLLFLIFQAIFSWSGPLMDWIDGTFGQLTEYLATVLPEGPLSSLFIDGIVAGIGGTEPGLGASGSSADRAVSVSSAGSAS